MSEVVTVAGLGRMRERVADWRAAHQTVALVPTMGNLHEGHLSLTRLARRVADRVVVTIFVNPTQFGVGEDYAAYPRTLDADRAAVDAAGTVDALYVPADEEVYPFGVDEAIRFTLPALSRELCGASRPGHFDGVASVVCRLLNMVGPDVLVLGRKDYQQLILIERMVRDLNMPVRVTSGRTQRHPDGLALSSRNQYLTGEERARAPVLHATLERVRRALAGGRRDLAALEAEAVRALEAEGFRPDYVEVRRAEDLAKPAGAEPARLVVLAAAWLGRARLIDNVSV